jgi:SAM-dependent methyltransferase
MVRQMNVTDRNPALATLKYGRGQVLSRLGMRNHHSGSTAVGLGLEKAVAYVRQVAEDYLRYGASGDAGAVEGKSILEIGPGDNLGVALMLLAKGAKSVTSLDGFRPHSDPEINPKLYAALYDSMTAEERARVDDVLEPLPAGGMAVRHGRLTRHYNAPIERPHPAIERGAFDIVLSRAVLEHLADIRLGWTNMVNALRPGGEMWHKVDFRCHRYYEAIHPIYFLTIPEVIWRMVSSPDPTLNRARLPVYREMLERDFVNWKIYYTHILGGPEMLPHPERLEPGAHYTQAHIAKVAEIRPRVAEPFRGHSDEDLMVTGIFLTARGKRSRS